MYRLNVGLVAGLSLCLTLTPAAAEKAAPDGTLELTGGTVAAGIGFGWASGTLTYQGKHYPISVQGIDVGDVGITTVTASGKVYNLRRLEDFEGTYSGVVGETAVAGGGGFLSMQNQHGVTVDLTSTTQGVRLALAVGGVKMNLTEEQREWSGAKEAYQRYCASCHGVEGKGNGPVAHTLKDPPTDLTELSKNNQGQFPRQRVYDVIDGRAEVRAHGPRDMPVWGAKFKAGDVATGGSMGEGYARANLMMLTRYLESIQAK
jgi:cytochrome c553